MSFHMIHTYNRTKQPFSSLINTHPVEVLAPPEALPEVQLPEITPSADERSSMSCTEIDSTQKSLKKMFLFPVYLCFTGREFCLGKRNFSPAKNGIGGL